MEEIDIRFAGTEVKASITGNSEAIFKILRSLISENHQIDVKFKNKNWEKLI
jgi:hypothetical protein